jgi:stress response protein YsnF
LAPAVAFDFDYMGTARSGTASQDIWLVPQDAKIDEPNQERLMSNTAHQETSLIPEVMPSMPSKETTFVVPVIEGSLVVDKRAVDQGGYRIVKTVQLRGEVVDKPRVTHSVNVERRAIGRLLTSMEVPPLARKARP